MLTCARIAVLSWQQSGTDCSHECYLISPASYDQLSLSSSGLDHPCAILKPSALLQPKIEPTEEGVA